MDIYLKELNNTSSSFRFPSMPNEGIEVSAETAYQEYNIISKGSVSFPSGMGKQPIEWNGYFWGESRKKYSSLNRKWVAPSTCVSKLSKWQKNKTPLTLIVSGGGINTDVTIKEFDWKPFGGHGDISYEISFLPYEEMKIYTTTELGISTTTKKKKTTTRNTSTKSTKKKKTYKIVKGDTLCKISKKKYGTTSKWRTIYKKNKSVIESAAKKHGYKNSDNGHWIFPGTTLTIP